MLITVPAKIVDLKQEIQRDIFNESVWVYVKIQALLEFSSKHYLETFYIESTGLQQATFIELMSFVSSEFIGDSKDIPLLQKINQNANVIKHNTSDDRFSNTKFESSLVEASVSFYNKMIDSFYGPEGSRYKFFVASNHSKSIVPILEKGIRDRVKPNPTQPVSAITDYSISCGVGVQDSGFQIRNVLSTPICAEKFACLYATVFSFMQRSDVATTPLFIRKYQDKTRIQCNYFIVYRLAMTMLLMIRNNYIIDGCLHLNCGHLVNESDLKIAYDLITHIVGDLAELAGMKYFRPRLVIDESGTRINIDKNERGCIFIDNTLGNNNHGFVWYEQNIRYQIRNQSEHENILLELLEDFFGFKRFKLGQKEALIALLNSNDNSACFLPTGGGKSLLFYYLALLQPNPTIVISPTRILIRDQIRNMKNFHGITNVQFIDEEAVNKQNSLDLQAKFIFITPFQLQHKHIIYIFIDSNVKQRISNIILDEIHTISHWGHDFRPDYLMLSFNLLTFIDKTRYVGFSATANFRVLNDIKNQLNLKSIIIPIEMTRDDITYRILPCRNEGEMKDSFSDECNYIWTHAKTHSDKMMVFTKGSDISKALKDSVPEGILYDIDVFTEHDPNSYSGFTSDRKCILIADSELSVCLNFENIHTVLHYGLPVSKGEFVQSIGRSSREGKGALSIVLYRDKKYLDRFEQTVLDFSSSIDDLLNITDQMEKDNDISRSIKKIIGHLRHYSVAAKEIKDLNSQLKAYENSTVLRVYLEDSEMRMHQTHFYFLCKIGIIYNWYIIESNQEFVEYLIELDHRKDDLSYLKKKSIEYISQFAENKKVFYQIENAPDVENIIYLVQKWYYEEFLYYHREQMLGMIDFLEMSKLLNSEEISDQLANYFSSSVAAIEDSEKKIIFLTIEEMIQLVLSKEKDYFIGIAEKYIENKYHVKLDLIILVDQLLNFNYLNESRFARVIMSLSAVDFANFLDNCHLLFREATDENKLIMFNSISARENCDDLFERLYLKNTKDKLYYAWIMRQFNKKLNS